MQCCTCLQAVALFPEAGLPRFHCCSDSQGASQPPRQVSDGRSPLPDSERTWGEARDSLSRAGFMPPDFEVSAAAPAPTGEKCAGREKKRASRVHLTRWLLSYRGAELISACDTEASAQGLTCPRFVRERTPRFCLPALMRADNGTGLGSRDFNQCCPKPSESH